MPPRSSPNYWIGRFLLGIALILGAGLGIFQRLLRVGDPLGLISLVCGFFGFVFAYSSITPLVRYATLSARTHAGPGAMPRTKPSRALRCRAASTTCSPRSPKPTAR
jgi:hypothetical protein